MTELDISIFGSIKDCLLDLSDNGYYIETSIGSMSQDLYNVRISPSDRFRGGVGAIDLYSYKYSGMHVFSDIRDSLCFLISYISDSKNISTKGISIRFENDKYNRQVTKGDFIYIPPVDLKDRDNPKDGSTWISQIESISLSGLTKSHILCIDITFERTQPKPPKHIEDWMDGFLNEGKTVQRNNWFNKIINKIM